jgi:hypothetical protein
MARNCRNDHVPQHRRTPRGTAWRSCGAVAARTGSSSLPFSRNTLPIGTPESAGGDESPACCRVTNVTQHPQGGSVLYLTGSAGTSPNPDFPQVSGPDFQPGRPPILGTSGLNSNPAVEVSSPAGWPPAGPDATVFPWTLSWCHQHARRRSPRMTPAGVGGDGGPG